LVDVGVEDAFAPAAGVEVPPKMFPPAGLLAPPNKLPPEEALVVWPNNGVLVAGALVGVLVAPEEPKRVGPLVPVDPPNKPPPVWGVFVPAAAEPNENEGVDPAAPKRLPVAGAVVDVVAWPEAALEEGVAKLKAIFAVLCVDLRVAAKQAILRDFSTLARILSRRGN
jgi:hypothetical protein